MSSGNSAAKRAAQQQMAIAQQQQLEANRKRAGEMSKAMDEISAARRRRMGFSSLLSNGFTGYGGTLG